MIQASSARPACRVEHRTAHGTTLLADDAVFLPPLAARLKAMGETGELVVVDRQTEAVIISWPLDTTSEPVAMEETDSVAVATHRWEAMACDQRSCREPVGQLENR